MRIEEHYQLWFDALLEAERDFRMGGKDWLFLDNWAVEIMDFASRGEVLKFRGKPMEFDRTLTE